LSIRISILLPLFVGLLGLFGLLSCKTPPAQSSKPVVAVSVLPQAGLVEALVSERAEVMVLVSPGQSPATYEPSPRQMSRLGAAWLYVRAGAPFERGFVGKLAERHPTLKLLDMRDVVPLLTKTGQALAKGADKDQADHHLWLDPQNLKLQARAIVAALAEKDPEGASFYQTRLASLEKAIDVTDQRIAKRLAPFAGRRFMVHHPAYTYFAKRYKLVQVAVEHGGKHPHAKDMAELIEHAKHEGLRVIFVQPQFSKSSAELVAKAIGGKVVPLDPLAKDLLGNLESMAKKIASAMKQTAEQP